MSEQRAQYVTDDSQYYTLTPEEQATLPDRILAILVENRAAKTRITSEQLCKRLFPKDAPKKHDRKVRLAIGELVLKGHLIVSSVRGKGKKGFFIAETQAEVDECVNTRLSRVRENLVMVKQIKRNAERWLGAQSPLSIEELAQ